MKEEVLKLVDIFGLSVDYNQWDEKGWIRVKDLIYTEMNPLILWKEDIKEIGIEYAKDELCGYLRKTGAYGFKKELNELIKL